MLVTESCPALCDPMDCSLTGSSIHGISQARILKWVAVSSNTSCDLRKRERDTRVLSLTGTWRKQLSARQRSPQEQNCLEL